MERICKNCRLFNEVDNVCSVAILACGQQYELPVSPNDECHWERVDREIQNELYGELDGPIEPMFKAKLEYELNKPIQVQQTRIWSDGKNGYIETTEEEED